MIQKERDLLLKDLCARLPYGVKCKIGNYDYIICDISFEKQYDVLYSTRREFPIGVIGTEDNGNTFYTSVYEKNVKPYLFPLSSITEEQYESLKESGILSNCSHSYEYVNPYIHGVSFIFKGFKTYSLELIEWLNENHFHSTAGSTY